MLGCPLKCDSKDRSQQFTIELFPIPVKETQRTGAVLIFQNSEFFFFFFFFVFCYRITIFTFFGVWFCFLWFILKSVDCSAFQISLVSKIYHRLSFLSETLSQNFLSIPITMAGSSSQIICQSLIFVLVMKMSIFVLDFEAIIFTIAYIMEKNPTAVFLTTYQIRK